MKKFKQLLCLALALTISASLLAACGQKDNSTDGKKDSDEKVLTYAVEGGSAGEEIALEKGWKITTLEDQAAADGGGLRHLRRRHHRSADGRGHDR